MPDLPISGLPTAGTLTGAELFAVVQGGVTKQDTLDNIHTYNLNYGVFQTNQTLSGSAATPYAFVIDTTDESNGVSITNGLDGRPSKITFSRQGTFNIQFSAQIQTGAGGEAIIDIWFKNNDNNIPESGTRLNVAANKFAVAAWNFVKTFNAGDKCEIFWQSSESTTQFPFIAAGAGSPAAPVAIPALIVTVTHVR